MKTFLMVSLLFFDSEQLLIYKQTQENASKYPKLIGMCKNHDFAPCRL